MPTRRQRRVAELIHRELSVLLMTEVRDPRVAGVTITDVEVTPDLLVARVFYTVMGHRQEIGEQEELQAAQAGLDRASGFLRTQLAGRVLLRLAPKLVFQLDQSGAYGRHIDALLDQISGTAPREDMDRADHDDEPDPDD